MAKNQREQLDGVNQPTPYREPEMDESTLAKQIAAAIAPQFDAMRQSIMAEVRQQLEGVVAGLRDEPAQDGPPDPWRDPVRYLTHHGWTLSAGEPRDPKSQWVDGRGPKETIYEKRKIGETKDRRTGIVTDNFQTFVTAPSWPLNRDAAVARQLELDRGAIAGVIAQSA